MTLKACNLILLMHLTLICFSQKEKYVSGEVSDVENNQKLKNVKIYCDGELVAKSNSEGFYKFRTSKNTFDLSFFLSNYNNENKRINHQLDSTKIDEKLSKLLINLQQVQVKANKEEVFSTIKLRDIESTYIYAGKKSEVVLLNNAIANHATNNPRQIYSQISGLNIYENDDAGLQLNIGGRGLDPNRTSNFNTRQNSYDISADVLGYPESYYTPPSESLEKIEIIRGAASLQYGTQFGGLINFITKKPNKLKKMGFLSRNTIGSNQLYTNFTSINGVINKFEYYTFFNFKKGNGFRLNSNFDSRNMFLYLGWDISSQTKITLETTYLRYLAQQAGGLTDNMFIENPYQSNRERNWFYVNWLLYNSKIIHDFSKNIKLSINLFGLKAKRYALGFRSNRVDQIDSQEERDLIKGEFKNYGLEGRCLFKYDLFKRPVASLFGIKIYNSNNTSAQGPGSSEKDEDFTFYLNRYPNYSNQSDYRYPNLNHALFTETVIYGTDKFSITPGIRFEHIKTKAIGNYSQINTDAAGNPIWDTTIYENRLNKRNFFLMGLGLSYKHNYFNEYYMNASENYRSVTFSDISIVNPAYVVNANIKDENGYSFDLGSRGKVSDILKYDINMFSLIYKDRIGFIQKEFDDGNVKSERNNIGDALIYGIESLIEIDLGKLIEKDNIRFTAFSNISKINSIYLASEQNGVEGNEVEFVPNYNIKVGTVFGISAINFNLQYSYISKQFTDATNAITSNLSGVIGQIPAYDVLDFSFNYLFNNYKLEFNINNLSNKSYFTRRATGYPGPGIIPSNPRTYCVTFELKL